MLINFGKTEKLLNYYEDQFTPCDQCGETEVTYRIVQNYFYVLNIPILPEEKFTSMNCTNCGYNHSKVMSENAKMYEKLSPTPIYLYTGSIILAITFLLFLGMSLYTALFSS
ncbi:hypothetical protein DHW03_06790 [Pedobacter yonginense]|uniref:Zinc-ribbon 15 domain-containing protein n=1 Tax=Pedobacter yonginense TaxID=651869 RepID=A0A317ERH5_9SPHI|nr:hypothetical protein [Pedobacter yonginense]PWS29510.1 hypothetical protein DHW03_06790 [Pedobacter yonginense]